MTAAIVRNPAVAEWQRLRDQMLAAGRRIPRAAFAMALADRHGEALAWLKERFARPEDVTRRPGKFAAEVAEPTADTMRITRRRALANIERELHDAGTEQLGHLARMAEACCSTDLGNTMRGLVDHERADRMFLLSHRIPAPPVDDLPQAGPRRGAGLTERVPPTYAALTGAGDGWPRPVGRERTSALGTDFWAIRVQRWEHAGRVGDPSDPAYDDFFYSDRGGEGGSW